MPTTASMPQLNIVITGASGGFTTQYVVASGGCPRCDRRARDDAEWRKFAREALDDFAHPEHGGEDGSD